MIHHRKTTFINCSRKKIPPEDSCTNLGRGSGGGGGGGGVGRDRKMYFIKSGSGVGEEGALPPGSLALWRQTGSTLHLHLADLEYMV